MDKLHLDIYRKGEETPEKKVTIPLGVVHMMDKLLPEKTKEFLAREQVDLRWIGELAAKRSPRGVLLQIETPEGKLVISLG